MNEKMKEPLSEEQILLIVNGDYSDIEELSDDEPCDISAIDPYRLEEMPELVCGFEVQRSCDIDDFENNTVAAVSDLYEQNQISTPGPSRLNCETEVQSSHLASDEEDNLPLSERLAKHRSFHNQNNQVSLIESNNKPINERRRPRWRHRDIETSDVTCNFSFSPPPDQIHTPYKYFKMFCDDNALQNICEQTNLYSTEKTGTSINTSVQEIEQFLGIHVMSGIVRVPSYKMYWQQSTRFAPIADTMSRNRFDKLRNFMHINDNSKMIPTDNANHDKLFKVRPFLESFRENINKIEPEEHNAVDEIIIPFKGRSKLKQYIKNKPHKWGIKMFARAGSSGIVYDIEVYVGKGTIKKTNLGISGDVVVRLTEGLPKNKNFKVYIDNWFTSHALLVELYSLGLLAIGTVRANRIPDINFKNDKILKAAGRGSSDYYTDTNNTIFALKWFDNQCVHVASSFVGHAPEEPVKRWSVAEKKYISVSRPAIIKQYNQHMGGVDLHDMLVELYRTDIRVKRYYLRIIFHLLDMCVVNAWLLYRRHCKQLNLTYNPLKNFKADIGHALLMCGKIPLRKRGRPTNSPSLPVKKRKLSAVRPVSDVRYDNLGHFPQHLEPKQRCKNCIKAYSRIMCVKCNVALCLTKDKNCFYNFHMKC